MKRITLLSLFISLFILNLNSAFSQDLSSNIMRRVNAANLELDKAEEQIRTGRPEHAPRKIKSAQKEYDDIFNYFKGRFDPNNPTLVKLKNRIESITKQLSNGNVEAPQSTQTVSPQKNASAPLESNAAAVEDLPKKMGTDLLSVASALHTLEQRLKTASKSGNPGIYLYGVKSDLKIVSDKFDRFNANYQGKINPDHVAYIQVNTRLGKDRKTVAAFEEKVAAAKTAGKKAQTAAMNAKEKQINAKYNEMAINSNLYKKYVGKIVWSDRIISFADQDRIPLKTSFKLSDPIFGRIFLKHSLGNSPVYDNSGNPHENSAFGYEFRLFIDGKEKTDKFNVFTSGNLNGQAGESWKTWQFAPNPVPADADFQKESDAWRRVTKNLKPGSHKVRFELRSAQGSNKSTSPISVGEFTLAINKGERIAAGGNFPKETYSGSGASGLSNQLKKALIAKGTASASEIKKLAITGNWVYNRYSDSKNEYRKISAAVLFMDNDNDGVCHFVTYNFISDKTSSGWSAPRFHSFCNGCPEGDVECP